MSRYWIKICGLTSEAALMAAIEAGADAVGFVFYERSVRHIAPDQAARLARLVPEGVLTVAVTRHPSQSLLDSIFAEWMPDVVQTDAADLEGLALPSEIRRLPVLRTREPIATPLPLWCLYESADSGQGKTADWTEAATLARQTRLVLAGGLRPETVAEAIRLIQPWGVDVSSGVESAPGVKDVRLIHQFVTTARRAEVSV